MSPVRGTHSLERGGSWCSESEEGWKDEEEGVSHLHQIVSQLPGRRPLWRCSGRSSIKTRMSKDRAS